MRTNEELRRALGTTPHDGSGTNTIYVGVEGITADLISATDNPYRAMVNMATATWGAVESRDRWSVLSPEARFEVILAVLRGHALPLALEAPQFTFEVVGCSRAAFDQIARARIGATFAAMGVRDNHHGDIGFRMPNALTNDERLRDIYITTVQKCVDAYNAILANGQSDWQAARAVLPMSMCYRFCMTMNYTALRNFCSRRLMWCEMEDTVAVAWLLRMAVATKFPLLASYLRPACDIAKRCVYHDGQQLSEAFGSLFRGCGRWPELNDYGIFNHSSSDPIVIAEQLGIDIPPRDEPQPSLFDELHVIDRDLFNDLHRDEACIK